MPLSVRHFSRMLRAAIMLISFAAVSALIGPISGADADGRDADEHSRSPALQTHQPIAFGGLPVRTPLWTLDAPEMLTRADASPVVLGDGAAFFGDQFGSGHPLRAVDPRNGKARWSTHLIATPQAYAYSTVLALSFGPDGAQIRALDSRTGSLRWTAGGTSVTVVRQLAIVTNGLHLEAHDVRSGKLLWSGPWNGAPPHEARLAGNTLLLQTFESGAIIVGVLYAYDILDGRPLWTKGGVNAIIGEDAKSVTVDVTWPPSAYATYAPLTTERIALATGGDVGTNAFAPDADRWNASTDTSVHFPQDTATDGDALVFRIGETTVYRYASMDAANREPPLRYAFETITRAGDDTWLARLPDGGAGIVRLDPAHASLRRITGLDRIDFTGVDDGLAFVAAHDRAVVFDPLHPAAGVVSSLPCTTVTRAFRADGTLVAVCSDPQPRLVSLAIPASETAASPTPLPIRAQHPRSFDAAFTAHDLPERFTMTRDAAFSSDGTLWFCEHAVFDGGVMGHTDFIGRLTPAGNVDEFPVPTNDANVVSITRGPDGAMWFTEASAAKLGRITADGRITEFRLPAEFDRNPVFPFRRAPSPAPTPPQSVAAAAKPPPPHGRARTFEKLGGIVAGADGALWVTAPFIRSVARVTTSGDVHVFPLPAELVYPGHIARGPDDALWITTRDAIARLSTTGDVRVYPLDTANGLTSIVWGPDGNLWFSFFDGRAGRITPRGEVRVFAAPPVAAPSGPLIGGCDGSLYVADPYRPALWRLTTAGEFTEHDAPFVIGSLARAPDCRLGATEAQAPAAGHVGTITLTPR